MTTLIRMCMHDICEWIVETSPFTTSISMQWKTVLTSHASQMSLQTILTSTDFHSVGKSLLPIPVDYAALKNNLSTLISRVLCKHVDFFRLSFDDLVKQHIQHRFYEDMSAKSTVVMIWLSHIYIFKIINT